MNLELNPPPAARHWRNIPQQVKPRAMSREGRRRLTLGFLRWAGGVVAVGVTAWGAWQAAALWRGDPGALGGGSAAVPLQHLTLTTDGVLDQAWLKRTLALPSQASLPRLNLSLLRARVLASGQAQEATLVRDFPATLAVRIAERTPVVRIMTQGADPASARALLVARDGVVYEGAGYDPAMLATLPWLDGIRLMRQDGGFAPIPGMSQVAALLTGAQSDTPALYQSWRVVSLAHLQSDGEIEVRARDGLRVIFGTQEEFYPQYSRLALLLDTFRAHPPGPIAQIDLSVPSQDATRPAAVVTPAAPGTASPPAPVAHVAPVAPPAAALFNFQPIHL